MSTCVFCKIVKGEIPTEKVNETGDVLAFNDINPSAETHILVVPKKHIGSLLETKKGDFNILKKMLELSQELIKNKSIEKKYKLVINGGKYQDVPHLHLHVLGGNFTEKV
jgi:histidine triad (HIT) family protein